MTRNPPTLPTFAKVGALSANFRGLRPTQQAIFTKTRVVAASSSASSDVRSMDAMSCRSCEGSHPTSPGPPDRRPGTPRDRRTCIPSRGILGNFGQTCATPTKSAEFGGISPRDVFAAWVGSVGRSRAPRWALEARIWTIGGAEGGVGAVRAAASSARSASDLAMVSGRPPCPARRLPRAEEEVARGVGLAARRPRAHGAPPAPRISRLDPRVGQSDDAMRHQPMARRALTGHTHTHTRPNRADP